MRNKNPYIPEHVIHISVSLVEGCC